MPNTSMQPIRLSAITIRSISFKVLDIMGKNISVSRVAQSATDGVTCCECPDNSPHSHSGPAKVSTDIHYFKKGFSIIFVSGIVMEGERFAYTLYPTQISKKQIKKPGTKNRISFAVGSLGMAAPRCLSMNVCR